MSFDLLILSMLRGKLELIMSCPKGKRYFVSKILKEKQDKQIEIKVVEIIVTTMFISCLIMRPFLLNMR